MKGLLIKDFRLMKVQKSFFLLITVIGVWGTLLSENVTSAIGFLTFVMSLFSVSSISYDEFDNGNAFLFSLPITRTTYVVEKYCFGLILGLGAWTVFTLLALVSNGFRRILPTGELMISAAMILPMFLVILAVMLPIQLRFGGEKGRDRADRGARYPDPPRPRGGKDREGDGNRSGRAVGRASDHKRGSAAGRGPCGGGSSVAAFCVDQPGNHKA